MADYKVVFMHGFSQDEMVRIMRGVKSVVEDPKSVAFCTSTERNLDFKVRDLIADVTEDHDYLLKHPPRTGEQPNADRPEAGLQGGSDGGDGSGADPGV
jgi:hypothetical protein